MCEEITLSLKRETNALWVEGYHRSVVLFYDVTGVERLSSDSDRYPVYVLRKGKPLGIVWDVAEIKEVW
jgi:hypothetical protein